MKNIKTVCAIDGILSKATMAWPGERIASRALMFFIIIILLSSFTFAANNPGHDSLYVGKSGGNITGNLNVSQLITASRINMLTRFFGDYIDFRANGTIYTPTVPAIQAGTNTLYIDSPSNMYINTKAGTTGIIQFGDTATETITVNVSGTLYEQGNRVCTASNGLCGSGVWSNVSGTATYYDNVNVTNNGKLYVDEICLNGNCSTNWGTGSGIVPSFSVHKNGVDQSISANTWVQINWSTKSFDTNNDFNLTNGSFKPSIPGKYLLTGAIMMSGLTSGKNGNIAITKNGAIINGGTYVSAGDDSYVRVSISVVVEADGNDYFDLRGYQTDSTTKTILGASTNTYFTGSRIDAGGGLWTQDSTLNISYAGNVTVDDTFSTPKICLAGDCQTSWPSGGTSLWTNSSGNATFTAGNVGIGTTTPGSLLDVNGTVNVKQVCDESGSNCKNISAGWYELGGSSSLNVNTSQSITTAWTTIDLTGESWDTNNIGSVDASNDVYTFSKAGYYLINIWTEISNTPHSTKVYRNAGALLTADGDSDLDQQVSLAQYYNAGDNLSIQLKTNGGTQTLTGAKITVTKLDSTTSGAGNVWGKNNDDAYFTAGNVGIGTTSPEEELHVVGDLKLAGSSAQVQLNNPTDTRNSRITNTASSGNSNIEFWTGLGATPTVKMILDENGRLGIGTTSPSTFLDVKGSHVAGLGLMLLNGSDHAYLSLDSGATGESGILLRKDGSNTWQFKSTNSGSDALNIVSRVGSDNTRLTIEQGGNVGIGTTNPATTLHVNSSGNTQIRLEGSTGFGQIEYNQGLTLSTTGTGGYDISILENGDNILGQYGNVGIGTSSPQRKLHLHNASGNANYLAITNGDTGSASTDGMVVGVGSSEQTYLWNYENTFMAFGTNGLERMRIAADGKVGIGTNNPLASLNVELDSSGSKTGLLINQSVTASGDTLLHVANKGSIGSGSYLIYSETDTPGEEFVHRGDGKVGIGTTSPTQALHVVGNFNLTGGNIYGANGEYVDIGGTDDYITFKGAGGTDNTDFRIDLDGSYPVLDSPTDTMLGTNEIFVILNSAQERIYSAGNDKYLDLRHTDTDGRILVPSGDGGLELQSVDSYIKLSAGTNVVVGTGTPGNATGSGDLYVTSDIEYDGNLYGPGADLAERIGASENNLKPGMVVELDPNNPKQVRKSSSSYSKLVAGVVSTDPGIILGKDSQGVELAVTGRVPVKVNDENGFIQVGDLLTTSSVSGEAMKCDDASKCFGSVIGKAMEPLNKKEGEIMVLVSLS